MNETLLKYSTVRKDYGFQMPDYWIWCGSVIAEKNNGFHLYASRWKKNYPMYEGYLLGSEIIRAWSPDMNGPFQYQESVLPTNNATDWNGKMAHNPQILKYGDKYLLYYIALSYSEPPPTPEEVRHDRSFLDTIYRRIRIGLATSNSPVGPWQLSEPILVPVPGSWDEIIVTNPSPCIHPDGRIFLYYRSNTPDGLRIGLAIAEKPEGPYIRAQNGPVLNFHIEDPFIWHDGEMFRMIAKDVTGNICGEKLGGAHFQSKNGVDWEPGSPPLGYSRAIQHEDGSMETLGCLERPFILFDDEKNPACLYVAVGRGGVSFHHITNSWNLAIPLVGTQVN